MPNSISQPLKLVAVFKSRPVWRKFTLFRKLLKNKGRHLASLSDGKCSRDSKFRFAPKAEKYCCRLENLFRCLLPDDNVLATGSWDVTFTEWPTTLRELLSGLLSNVLELAGHVWLECENRLFDFLPDYIGLLEEILTPRVPPPGNPRFWVPDAYANDLSEVKSFYRNCERYLERAKNNRTTPEFPFESRALFWCFTSKFLSLDPFPCKPSDKDPISDIERGKLYHGVMEARDKIQPTVSKSRKDSDVLFHSVDIGASTPTDLATQLPFQSAYSFSPKTTLCVHNCLTWVADVIRLSLKVDNDRLAQLMLCQRMAHCKSTPERCNIEDVQAVLSTGAMGQLAIALRKHRVFCTATPALCGK